MTNATINRRMIHTDGAHGIMFHHFYNNKHPRGQGAISGDQLAQIIEFYGPERFISAREWFDRAQSHSLCPTDVCLTYDDALLCQYEIALPVMEHYNITGFWFVYTLPSSGGIGKLELYRKFRTVCFESVEAFYDDFFKTIEYSPYAKLVKKSLAHFSPGKYLRNFVFYTDRDRTFRYIRDIVLKPKRYENVMDLMILESKIDIPTFTSNLWMSKNQIQELHKKGHVVGLHSHTHPTAIANLSRTNQMKEYGTNYQQLTEMLGDAPVTMSHPNNSYNQDSLDVLSELSISLGFRANMLKGFSSQLEFPREDHTNIAKLLS